MLLKVLLCLMFVVYVTATSRKEYKEQKLKDSFANYGEMTKEEWKFVIKAMYKQRGHPVSEEHLEDIFKSMDTDRNHAISEEEFIEKCMYENTFYDFFTQSGTADVQVVQSGACRSARGSVVCNFLKMGLLFLTMIYISQKVYGF